MLVHVGVWELAHEGVRAVGALGADARGELGVAVPELVDGDGDDVGVVVELDEALEALSCDGGERKESLIAIAFSLVDFFLVLTLVAIVALCEDVLLHLLDGIADVHAVGHGRVEAEHALLAEVIREVGLALWEQPKKKKES